MGATVAHLHLRRLVSLASAASDRPMLSWCVVILYNSIMRREHARQLLVYIYIYMKRIKNNLTK